MSHYAKIEDGIVTSVIVADDDFITTIGGEWIQTSYNTYRGVHTLGGTPLRGNFAEVGGSYDRAKDVFIPKQPHPTWILDDAGLFWKPSELCPGSESEWVWVEGRQWVKISTLLTEPKLTP
jgi:hypothetical protein